MNSLHSIAAFALVNIVCFCFALQTQAQYPTTSQGSFAPTYSESNFAVTSPQTPDPIAGAFEPTGFPEASDTAMSPDHWGSPGGFPDADDSFEIPTFQQTQQSASSSQGPSNFVPATSSRVQQRDQIPMPPSGSYDGAAPHFQATTDPNRYPLYDDGNWGGPAIQVGNGFQQDQTGRSNEFRSRGLMKRRYQATRDAFDSVLQTEQQPPSQQQLNAQQANPNPIVDRNTPSRPSNGTTTIDRPRIPQGVPQSNAVLVNPGPGPIIKGQPGPSFDYPSPVVQPQQQIGTPFAAPSQSYRPDLGHRNSFPTVRHGPMFDNGQRFEFEQKKKEYPPMSEILKTGRYFGSFEAMYIKPHFQANAALSISSPASTSEQFDYDFELAPKMKLGFESSFGPGFEMTYFQFDQNSNVSTFTSNGISTADTSAWQLGPSRWTRLTASNPGETLNVDSGLEVHYGGAAFFKEIQFPISRLNGIFGFKYASIAHELSAQLTDAGGAEIGRLFARSDTRVFGPHVGFEYLRPVGHTKLTLQTHFNGSLMFGNRDQIVENSVTGDFSSIGADEFVTAFDFGTSLLYKQAIGEKRFVYGKIGFSSQVWLNGGTTINPQGDFGFRGFSFAVGFNR